MKNKSLTLAFSCLGEKFIELTNQIALLTLTSDISVVIVLQKPLIGSSTVIVGDSIKVIVVDTIGLSKSRNTAMSYATSDFIWFLDDDVSLASTSFDEVLACINQEQADFFRVQIGCIESKKETYKKYKKIRYFKKLNLLQVSSIEIIANLSFIKLHHLQFNEKIGLGTKFNAGEDNNFLIDAWQVGAVFTSVDKVMVRHTCVFDGRILATNDIFEIRGATASRFGMLGMLIIIRWSIRYLIKEKKWSYIWALLRGFVRGYDRYK